MRNSSENKEIEEHFNKCPAYIMFLCYNSSLATNTWNLVLKYVQIPFYARPFFVGLPTDAATFKIADTFCGLLRSTRFRK